MEQREWWYVAFRQGGNRFYLCAPSLAKCRVYQREMAFAGWKPLYRFHVRLKPKQD